MSPNLDPRDQLDPVELDGLHRAFAEQLQACLEECQRGRRGLFAQDVNDHNAWPEAGRLRELALALAGVYSAHERRNALADEFLDLCSISSGAVEGEVNPGERRLARAFLDRIERGQVGTPVQEEGDRR